jgi:hypothetical protein
MAEFVKRTAPGIAIVMARDESSSSDGVVVQPLLWDVVNTTSGPAALRDAILHVDRPVIDTVETEDTMGSVASHMADGNRLGPAIDQEEASETENTGPAGEGDADLDPDDLPHPRYEALLDSSLEGVVRFGPEVIDGFDVFCLEEHTRN